jgi:multiple antibiotic resistance protein
MIDLNSLISSFITIFVIMDPFASSPYFLALTQKMTREEAVAAANKAITIAGVIAVVFLFVGPYLLDYLGVTLDDFRVAGGIVLGLLGLEMVLGFSLSPPNVAHNWNAVAVIIATPLLTGPGLLSSLLILSNEHGYWTPLLATAAALFCSWVLLRESENVREKVGHRPIEVLSKVFGLFLLTIAVHYVRVGLSG